MVSAHKTWSQGAVLPCRSSSCLGGAITVGKHGVPARSWQILGWLNLAPSTTLHSFISEKCNKNYKSANSLYHLLNKLYIYHHISSSPQRKLNSMCKKQGLKEWKIENGTTAGGLALHRQLGDLEPCGFPPAQTMKPQS